MAFEVPSGRQIWTATARDARGEVLVTHTLGGTIADAATLALELLFNPHVATVDLTCEGCPWSCRYRREQAQEV